MIADGGPRARAFGGVAYDSRHDKVILQGGRMWVNSLMSVASDTWEWHDRKWAKVADSIPNLNRDHFMMVYDQANDRMIFAGGARLSDDKSVFLWPTDTWVRSGGIWKPIDTTFVDRISNMVVDRKRNGILMFGGVGDRPARDSPGAIQRHLVLGWQALEQGQRERPICPARARHELRC